MIDQFCLAIYIYIFVMPQYLLTPRIVSGQISERKSGVGLGKDIAWGLVTQHKTRCSDPDL